MDAQLSTKASEATIKMSMGEYMRLWGAYTELVWETWLGRNTFTLYGPQFDVPADEMILDGRRLWMDFEDLLQNPTQYPIVYEIIKCPGCGFDTRVKYSDGGPNKPAKCAFCTDPELREGV